MQSRIKHLLKHFALVLKAKLNQLKPFVRFVFHPSTLLPSPTYRIIKGLHIQTLFILLYASFSCPYDYVNSIMSEWSSINYAIKSVDVTDRQPFSEAIAA